MILLLMSVTTLIKFEVTLLTRLASGCCRCGTVCASLAAVGVWVNQAVRSTLCLKKTSPTFLPRCMECRRGLAMRILSFLPSVCPSVTRVCCDQRVERSAQIYIPYERTFSLDFWEEEWLVGATPSTWKFRSTDPR